MRTMNRLTALQAQRMLKKPGLHADGGNLYLQVKKVGSGSWLFRYERDGVETWMGLGSVSDVSLAEARAEAAECRKLLAAGRDPFAKRKASRAAAKQAMTFGEAATACFEAKRHQWRNEKHGDQWRMTLDVYAAPLHEKPVDTITTADILAILKPIWTTKPETASRVRGRVEMVLDYARALGHISEDKANVARWKGHLDKLLAKRTRLSRGHLKAMPFREVPEFVAKLRDIDTTGARAVELIILTAARMNEVLGMTKDEIDWERRIWTVPATRIKSARPHRVPLVDRALEIVREASAASDGHYVFGGHRHRRPVSPTAVTMTLKRLEADATCHGFRSSFADWRGDATRFSRELAEAALAHIVGDQTEAAYRRGDALERRREMMEAWTAFIDRPIGERGEVLQLSRVN
jgi:integrase